MDAHALHLALAALVGASFVAVSAYYMHRKTLNQLLEFAKTIDRAEREREEEEEEEDDAEQEDLGRVADSPRHFKRYVDKRRNYGRKKGNGYYRRSSASLPDVTAFSCPGEGDERRNGPVRVDSIPAGLPRLHTLPEGMRPG